MSGRKLADSHFRNSRASGRPVASIAGNELVHGRSDGVGHHAALYVGESQPTVFLRRSDDKKANGLEVGG